MVTEGAPVGCVVGGSPLHAGEGRKGWGTHQGYPLPRRGEGVGKGVGYPPRGGARGVGIEKALAVRRGVEKIYYSKDTITVRFKCVSDSDGKPGDSSLDAAASPCPPPAVFSPAPKTERPVSKLETGPTLKLERLQNVEHTVRPPTLNLLLANIAHDYWENYRLTGDYNLRPS